MSRFTSKDAEWAFSVLKGSAKDAGFNTEDWYLHHGNSSYGYNWRVFSDNGQIGKDLGTTAREAYRAMLHMAEAWDMLGRKK